MIAGIGVLLDQPILIVGAMVVGPEFGPIAGLCVALALRERALAARSLRALVIGFPFAIGVAVLATLVARAVGLVDPGMLDSAHPLTSFISRPDAFSFIVSFLAGIAGILSLTSAKSGALIGVLISVTTVPAAGNTAVALALGDPATAGGSLLQLAVNVSGMVLAGTLTLLVQRRRWRRSRGGVHAEVVRPLTVFASAPLGGGSGAVLRPLMHVHHPGGPFTRRTNLVNRHGAWLNVINGRSGRRGAYAEGSLRPPRCWARKRSTAA